MDELPKGKKHTPACSRCKVEPWEFVTWGITLWLASMLLLTITGH